MTLRNVGIVFSPTLNIPTPVLSMFLTEFDAVFGESLEPTADPSLKTTGSESLTAEDVRSPRRQISHTQEISSTSSPLLSHSHEQAPSSDTIDAGDTGLNQLQPTYDMPSIAMPQLRNMPAGGATKARRRESSMLLIGPGQGKGSLSMMTGDDGKPFIHHVKQD